MRLGDSLPSVSKSVIQKNINMYADASGDHNPLHLDEVWAATATDYGTIVAHGMLVMAYVSEMLSRAFGQEWVENGRLKVRFRAPVYPGDRVHTFGQILASNDDGSDVRVKCVVGCRNQDGVEVINGEAWVSVSRETFGGIEQ